MLVSAIYQHVYSNMNQHTYNVPYSNMNRPQVYTRAFLVAQMVKNLPTVQETGVLSLSREDHLEKQWEPTLGSLPGEFH